ncbi:MAG: DUF5723 family protein [Alistipes sp.]
MKQLLALFICLFLVNGVAAQNPTTYFMEGSTLRSQLNPAFAPLRGYVNIPGLGGVNINTSGNLALSNILFPVNGKLVTLLDSSVSAAMALDGLNTNNLLGMDTRINLIGFGAFTRNHMNFWSFDITARVNMDAHLPYSLFEFLKSGQEGDISDISLCADAFLEAGFNYSFPVAKDKLYIGIRGKVLFGAARGRMSFNKFAVTLNEDRWFVDAVGELDLSSSGLDIATSTDEHGHEIYKPKDISLRPKAPAGYGVAVDVGLVYDIRPNLQASLAINDIGFICWGKGDNQRGVVNKTLLFEGVEINGVDGSVQPNFDLGEIDFEKSEPTRVTKMLRASINAGLEYEVWRHKIGFGLLYSARIWEYKTLHNLTGSINFHPVRWFTVSGSYSIFDNKSHAVGLALNLNPNWINFYIATDILTSRHTPQFLPIRQSMMNITLGVGIPIGKRSYRILSYINSWDKR